MDNNYVGVNNSRPLFILRPFSIYLPSKLITRNCFHQIYVFYRKMCKNNNPECNHIRAPRGSKTGTQSISKLERYKIPSLLIEEFIKLI